MNKNTYFQAAQLFKLIWDQIILTAQYDPSWENGTGYFDHAVSYPLAPGTLQKSTDTHGRKIILVGTRFGTVPIFQRVGDEEGPIVFNKPKKGYEVFRVLLGRDGPLSNEILENVAGFYSLDGKLLSTSSNIGLDIENMAGCF